MHASKRAWRMLETKAFMPNMQADHPIAKLVIAASWVLNLKDSINQFTDCISSRLGVKQPCMRFMQSVIKQVIFALKAAL